MTGIAHKMVSISENHHSRITCLILLVLLLAGFLYSMRLGGELTYSDERAYYSLAENLADNGFYSTDGMKSMAYWPPGNAMAMTPFVALGLTPRGLRMVNFWYLAAAIFVLGRFLKKHHSATASVVGMSICALYPIFFYTAGTLYPQVLGFLLLISIVSLLCSETHFKARVPLLGCLNGFLILTIPAFLLILPFAYLWAWLTRSMAIRSVAFTAGLTLLIVGSWTTRNYVTFGEFVLISTNSGVNLLLGNSENTTPNAGVNTDISEYHQEAEGMDEFERNRYYTGEAIAYAISHPGRTLTMYFGKLVNYFNFRNQLATESESSRTRDLIMLLSYGPLLILFLVRLALFRRYKPDKHEMLLALLYVVSGMVYAIFFTRIRFRIPFDLLLIAACSLWIGGMLHSRGFPTTRPERAPCA